VFTFLASHVLAWPDVEARTSLLRIFSQLHDKSRLVLFSPLLEQAIEGADWGDLPEERVANYVEQLFEGYQKGPMGAIDEEPSKLLLAALKRNGPSIRESVVRKHALNTIKSSVFANVKPEAKVHLLEAMAVAATSAPDVSALDFYLKTLHLL
jgi:hypothetical protein